MCTAGVRNPRKERCQYSQIGSNSLLHNLAFQSDRQSPLSDPHSIHRNTHTQHDFDLVALQKKNHQVIQITEKNNCIFTQCLIVHSYTSLLKALDIQYCKMKGRPVVTRCIPDHSLSVSSLLKQHCGPESEMLGRDFGGANDGPPVELSHCIKVKLCGMHTTPAQ